MKASLIFSVCISSFLPAMHLELKTAPEEIIFYNKSIDWSHEHEQELLRDSIVYQAIKNLTHKKNLNSNDICHGGFNFYGNTSVLFDVSDDDSLIGVARELMEAGANPNFATSTGHTPFERAIRSNALRIAWDMVSYKADCKTGLLVLMDHACTTTDKRLFLAQEVLAKKMLEVLEAQKVPITAIADKHGQNLLMKITQIKRDQSGPFKVPEQFRVLFAALLLKQKVDANEPDFHGESAIDKARKNKLFDLELALAGKLSTNDLV